MTNNDSFEVFVSGGSTSVAEYSRAMTAPKSQLPELTEQQKLVVKKLGLSEEEYRRGVLADRWLARITSADDEHVVEIPRDLADDVLKAQKSEAGERLKAFLLRSLKPENLVAKS